MLCCIHFIFVVLVTLKHCMNKKTKISIVQAFYTHLVSKLIFGLSCLLHEKYYRKTIPNYNFLWKCQCCWCLSQMPKIKFQSLILASLGLASSCAIPGLNQCPVKNRVNTEKRGRQITDKRRFWYMLDQKEDFGCNSQ